MNPVLEQAKWGVGDVGPGQVVAHVGQRPARAEPWAVAHCDPAAVIVDVRHELGPAVFGHELGTAAVVREKENKAVVEEAVLFEALEHPADVLVHAIDHGGIDRHAGGFPIAMRDCLPGARVPVPRADVPAVPQHAPGLQLFVTGSANGVPALAVDAVIAGDILFVRMQRPVRRRVRQVEEEGLVGFHALVDHLERVLGDRVSVVVAGRRDLHAAVVFHHVVRREEIQRPVESAVEAIEAALSRCWMHQVPDPPAVDLAGDEIAADMPLAGHAGPVTRQTKHLRNRHAVVAQEALIGRRACIDPHMPDAGVVRVEAG